jgi:hypothetical protein
VFFLGLSIIRLHYKMTRVPLDHRSGSHQATQEEQDLVAVEDIL